MSVSVTVAPTVTTVETLDTNPDAAAAAQRRITWAAFNDTLTLNATSNPPATKHSGFVKTLVAGVATVDLTALTGADGAAINGTGLKLQVLRVKNLGANDLVVSTGASNGYNFGGPVTIKPGGTLLLYQPEGLPDVAAGAKNIDLAGNTTQQSRWTCVLG